MKFGLVVALLVGVVSAAAEEQNTTASAYYYPWYGDDGRHWREGYPARGTSDAPALGEYASDDTETVRRHLAWSREYGVANWICSWWGPDSWEDRTLRHRVLPVLEAESSTTFCIFYEAQGLLGLDEEKGIVFDAAKTETFVSHFRFLADQYFSHPRYLHHGGKPVVYLYLSRTFAGDYERALLRARAVVAARGLELFLVGDEVYWGEPEVRRLSLYDAITSYNMHGPLHYAGAADWSRFVADCGEVYGKYRAAAAEEGVRFLPGVIPAFDTAGRHYSIPRSLEAGAGENSFFEAMLTMAGRHLDPDLGTVVVTSFNEWHEGTQIEPSQRGGNGGEALRKFLSSTP